jgi:hypothetical protein
MAAEAEFTRAQTGTGVEYKVTPAATSTRYSITAWLLVIVIAGVLGIQTANTRGLLSLACAAGAVLILALGFFRLRDDKAARSQQTILTVSKAGLSGGGQAYELNDIAELLLVNPAGQPVGRSGVLMGIGGEGAVAGVAMGAAAGIGAAMAAIDGAVAAQAARSWSISLLRRSTSKPVLLVSHLTEDPGSALLNDLARTIRAL